MLSVIIATENSERELVATLAALVPGALAGLVREVIVADAGSRDETAKVADIAGCKLVTSAAPAGARLKAAASSARGPWLLFLRPGAVPEPSWIDEVGRFMSKTADARAQAAVFRRTAAPSRRRAVLAAALVQIVALGRPRPQQGLLIAKQHYESLGGHAANGVDPETEFLRRLGRRRIATLHSGVAMRSAES
jgi:glycosyltransferase involved in cell wall biosynthesis